MDFRHLLRKKRVIFGQQLDKPHLLNTNLAKAAVTLLTDAVYPTVSAERAETGEIRYVYPTASGEPIGTN